MRHFFVFFCFGGGRPAVASLPAVPARGSAPPPNVTNMLKHVHVLKSIVLCLNSPDLCRHWEISKLNNENDWLSQAQLAENESQAQEPVSHSLIIVNL